MMPRHVVSLAVMVLLGGQADRQPLPPRPIRNDEPRRGTEVLVLRHQQLRKGAHEQYGGDLTVLIDNAKRLTAEVRKLP